MMPQWKLGRTSLLAMSGASKGGGLDKSGCILIEQ